jgi:hypothetical protein
MIPLKADQNLLGFLAGAHEPIEVYDVTGEKLLGIFIPANMERCNRVYADAIARTDLAELKRRAAEPGPRRLHREVIDELKRRFSTNALPESPPTETTVEPGSSECVAP